MCGLACVRDASDYVCERGFKGPMLKPGLLTEHDCLEPQSVCNLEGASRAALYVANLCCLHEPSASAQLRERVTWAVCQKGWRRQITSTKQGSPAHIGSVSECREVRLLWMLKGIAAWNSLRLKMCDVDQYRALFSRFL